MCGIAGILFNHGQLNKARQLVERILVSQENRGPDHQGILAIPLETSTCFLGHNRLSIIDSREVAHQPMRDPSGRFTLVYNGMLYNYQSLRQALISQGCIFKTQGDTEVVLMALMHWGPAALSQFNGMFALGFFDSQKEELLLARDRFGVKPLYYCAQSQEVIFASTVNEIAREIGAKPDMNYIARGLAYSVYETSESDTPYERVKQCRPGHYVVCQFRAGELICDSTAWYSLVDQVSRQFQELETQSTAALTERYYVLLEESVRLRLQSDVPVALSLSGGLDSSTVLALATQITPMEAFSYSDPLNKESEGPLVAQIGKYLDSKVHYVGLSPTEFIDSFYKTLDAQGAPFSSLSVVAQHAVFEHAKSLGFKVLLGGQGGDESLMGYRKYQWFHLQESMQSRQWKNTLIGAKNVFLSTMSERQSWQQYWQQRGRYCSSTGMTHRLQGIPAAEISLGRGNNLRLRQQSDVTDYSLPTLLRYEDRNSMGNSIESRLPFLDYQLMELSSALPLELILRNGYGKWILRDVMRGVLPDELLWMRRKRGFDIQTKQVVEGGLGREIRSVLKKQKNKVNEFVSTVVDIDEWYSDNALNHHATAMREAITLMWLVEQT